MEEGSRPHDGILLLLVLQVDLAALEALAALHLLLRCAIGLAIGRMACYDMAAR